MQKFPAQPSFDVYRNPFPVRFDSLTPAGVGFGGSRPVPQFVMLDASRAHQDASDLARVIAAAGLSTAWLHED